MPVIDIPPFGPVRFDDSLSKEALAKEINRVRRVAERENAAYKFDPREELSFTQKATGGFRRTLSGLGSLATDVLPATLGSALGFEDYAREQMEEAKAKRQAIEERYPTAFRKLEDIRGVGDLPGFVSETLGEGAVDILSLLAPGGIGAVAGRRLATRGATEAGKEIAERIATRQGSRYGPPELGPLPRDVVEKLEKTAARRYADTAGDIGARRGFQAGVGTGAYGLATGDIFQNVYEETGELSPGLAATLAVPYAALDAIVPSILGRQLGGTGKTLLAKEMLERSTLPEAKGLARRLAVTLPRLAALEGVTEAGQESINILAEQIAGSNKEFFAPENVDRMLFAGVKGGIAGGVLGTPTSVIEAVRDKGADQALIDAEQARREAKTAKEQAEREEAKQLDSRRKALFDQTIPGETIPLFTKEELALLDEAKPKKTDKTKETDETKLEEARTQLALLQKERSDLIAKDNFLRSTPLDTFSEYGPTLGIPRETQIELFNIFNQLDDNRRKADTLQKQIAKLEKKQAPVPAKTLDDVFADTRPSTQAELDLGPPIQRARVQPPTEEVPQGELFPAELRRALAEGREPPATREPEPVTTTPVEPDRRQRALEAEGRTLEPYTYSAPQRTELPPVEEANLTSEQQQFFEKQKQELEQQKSIASIRNTIADTQNTLANLQQKRNTQPSTETTSRLLINLPKQLKALDQDLRKAQVPLSTPETLESARPIEIPGERAAPSTEPLDLSERRTEKIERPEPLTSITERSGQVTLPGFMPQQKEAPVTLSQGTVLTPQLLDTTGLPRTSGIYKQLKGKDLSNKDIRTKVQNTLVRMKENTAIPNKTKEKVIALASAVSPVPIRTGDLFEPKPKSKRQATPTPLRSDDQTGGAGVSVSDRPGGTVPSAGTSTPGATGVEDAATSAASSNDGKGTTPGAVTKGKPPTELQQIRRFGQALGTTQLYPLGTRINLQTAKAVEKQDFQQTLDALSQSKNPLVREVAQRARPLKTKIMLDEDAFTTIMSEKGASEAMTPESYDERQRSIDGAKMHLAALDSIREIAPKLEQLSDKAILPADVLMARVQAFENGKATLTYGLDALVKNKNSMFVPLELEPNAKFLTKKDFVKLQNAMEAATKKAGEDSIRLTASASPYQQDFAGTYDAATDTIKIPTGYTDKSQSQRENNSAKRFYAKRENILAHEIVHAQTINSIANPTKEQKPIVERLEKLYKHVKQHYKQKQKREQEQEDTTFLFYRPPYGIASIQEFIAEGLSNAKFQYELSRIPYENTSVWDKFVQSIAGLLGLKNDNAFTELLTIYSELTNQDAIQQQLIKAAEPSQTATNLKETDTAPSSSSTATAEATPAAAPDTVDKTDTVPPSTPAAAPLPTQDNAAENNRQYVKDVLAAYERLNNDLKNKVAVKLKTPLVGIPSLIETQPENVDDVISDVKRSQLRLEGSTLGQPLAPEVKASLERNDLRAALTALSTLSGLVGRTSKALLRGNIGTKVKVVDNLTDETNRPVAGYFDPKTNTIYLDRAEGLNTHVALHESLHAATSHVLSNPSHPVTKQLQTLFDSVKGALDTAYGARSLDEFVAEAFSNPEFQAKLQNMFPDGTKISAWTRFTRTIANLFRSLANLERLPTDSAFKRIDHLVTTIISPAPESREDIPLFAMVQNPKLSESVINGIVSTAEKVGFNRESQRNIDEFMRNTTSMALRKFVTDFLPLHALTDLASEYLPRARELNTLVNLHRGESTSLRNQIDVNVDRVERWAKTASQATIDRFNDLVYGSTLAKINVAPRYDPKLKRDIDFKETDYAPADRAEYRRLAALYNGLDAGGKQAYRDMRDTYAKLYTYILDGLTGRIDAMVKDKEAAKTVRQTILAKLVARGGIDPYFPLTREGAYWLSYKTKDANGQVDFVVEAFPQELARKDRIKELGNKASDVKVFSQLGELDYSRVPSTSFLKSILDVVPEGSRNEVLNLFVNAMPETAFAKSFQARKETSGYQRDAVGAFRKKAFPTINQIVNLKYGSEMDKVLTDMEKDVIKKQESAQGDVMLERMYLDKLREHAKFVVSPNFNTATQILQTGTFGMTLGFNISSGIVNLSQIPLIVQPFLAASYGQGNATRELAHAYKLVLGSTSRRDQTAFVGEGDRDRFAIPSIANYDFSNPKLPKNIAALRILVQRAQAQGQLNDSHIYSILEGDAPAKSVGATKGFGLEKVKSIAAFVSKHQGFFMHQGEQLNRQVSLIAAYNLELAKMKQNKRTIDEAAQIEAADKAIYTTELTNGGISQGAAPLITQRYKLARLAFMYKRFGVSMYYTLFKSAKAALSSSKEDAETKAAAWRHLGYTAGMVALGSGIQGLPLYGVIALAYNMFKDDDEEPFDEVVRRGVSEIPFKGILNYGLGVEVASRIGLSDLIMRDVINENEKTLPIYLLEAFGGPVYGTFAKWERGQEQIKDGDVARGIETMLPASLGNLMRAFRFANEGATTLRGDPIVDDINSWNVFAQAFGFAPVEYVRQLEINAALKGIDKAVNKEKTETLRRYYLGYRMGDTDVQADMLERLQDLEARHPGVFPKGLQDTLQRSMRQHMKTTQEMYAGISLSKNLRRELLELAEEYEDD